MHFLTLLLPLLATPALSAPEAYIEERHVLEITKRQADVAQLLQLASLAGITAFPTDPAALLAIGPLASSLAQQLPTPSVLSQLVTAAPSGFLSSILNNPSYANQFASEFAAGSSPSWFNGLPTDVRSYLHTYSGFNGVASAAQAVGGGLESAGVSGASGLASAANAASGSASGALASVSASVSGVLASASSAAAGKSMSMTSSASGADTQTTMEPGQGGNAETSATRSGGASRPTAVLAAGVIGAMGVLGVVGL